MTMMQAMLVALLVHTLLAVWLMTILYPQKPQPVTILSMEWVEVAEHDSVVPVQTQVPAPAEMESVAEPEPVMVHKDVAPPPKPVVVKTVNRTVNKTSVVRSAPTVDATASSENAAAVQESSLSRAETPSSASVLAKAEVDYLSNPRPRYPRLSKKMGEQGEVILRVQVGEDGSVLVVELASSSGFERLDAAAMSSVQSWRFKPARMGDKTISSWVEIPVKFVLEQGDDS